MNTNPDDEKLARWLDGELQGEELREFETHLQAAAGYQELLRQRDGVIHWKTMVSAALPASEDPPYPDFFNSKIASAIQTARPVQSAEKSGFSWRRLLMPVTACAGMAMAFWLGSQSQPRPIEIDVTGAPKAIPVEPVLYAPESGVEAEYFAGSGAASTVIVLNGVEAIPDETDFSETAEISAASEEDSTAGLEDKPEQGGTL